ncbi:phosphatidylethanolamine N-methyltransferase [Friedmanniomyces endolithicus]|nr:phosphatidylethanolamine N-methyltransferase [Friedmanniomyces endolithicus]
MSELVGEAGVDVNGLREWLPQHPEAPLKAESVETAQEAVKTLNEDESKNGEGDKDMKTYGRTPDGTDVWICASEHSIYCHRRG